MVKRAVVKKKAGKVVYNIVDKKGITARQQQIVQTKTEQGIEAKLRRDVVNHVIKGYSYEEISEKLGVSTTEAYSIFKENSAKWRAELLNTREQCVEIELKRLDKLQVLLMDAAFPHPLISAETGMPILSERGVPIMSQIDYVAAKMLIDICDRRAKLLGLDAADKIKAQAVDIMERRYVGVNPDAL